MNSSEYDELDVEVDETQEDEVSVTYDIATYPSDFTLGGIVDMWKDGDITIPDFQREFVWTAKQSSLLIESFLLGLPVPPVFFYIDDENKNLVIDGQQRILSVVFFFEGYFGSENLQGRRQVFRLIGLDEKSPFYRKKYDDFSESNKRKLKQTVLRAINIRQLSPVDESTSVYHIFERLNTGGTPLKSQEIRNVVFRGNVVKVLRDLNADKNWRIILGRNKLDKHQKDVELILRLFALSRKTSKYEKPMKDFLNKAQQRHRDASRPEIQRFQKLFPQAAKTIVDILGAKPFHVRGPLNTSVLDSVFCTILANPGNLPNGFKQKYLKLVKDPKFEGVTTTGTTDTQVVRDRFEMVNSYLFGG